ncbi:hypothetical protein BLNAU_10586 [Blattamonas nauphoetae]|uniref:Uncharacterized protein n=1 Tax=Blattamonas nauphoetae TaxID=2049346 RepID=A0ABQ9XPS3_9EUKA|nr:hypothetical protein BLNAU_10586 [Blattamonas nauphoetae]
MTAVAMNTATSSSTVHSDCTPFLNWTEAHIVSEDERAVVFRSLVATVKSQPALDASLEAKAVKLLESVVPHGRESADTFLNSIMLFSDESLTDYVQSIVVLISLPSQIITTTTMKMLVDLISSCSSKLHFALVQADLIPQIVNALNPQSLSLAESVNIHISLMSSVAWSFSLASPLGLTQLEIEDGNEQQAVHETNRIRQEPANLRTPCINTLNPLSLYFEEAVHIHTNLMLTINYSLLLTTPEALEELEIEDDDEQQAAHETVYQQVLAPSEKYLWHLCVNRYLLIEGGQSTYFLELLAHLLRISPHYQRTMDFVLRMPVILTIPSCLTFFEDGRTISLFLIEMVDIQREWNRKSGEERHMLKAVQRILRMEDNEDVIEQRLLYDQGSFDGGKIVYKSIEWSNLLVRNLPGGR